MLDTVRRRLLRHGDPVALGDRAFDLLLALAAAEGRAVAADELISRVWPGVTVSPGNLRVQVRALRRALGDAAVENVPGAGYRLALPLAAASATLPGPADLVGRDADLVRLRDLLTRSRLVSVVGPGGVGKTSLALSAAAACESIRVAHVELAPVRQPELVRVVVAAALQVRLADPDTLGAIQAALRDQHTLLVMDNAEHLLDEVGDFADALLAACPSVRLLLTSREPLNADGELLLHLCPLECPPEEVLEPADIRSYPAVQLVLRNHERAGWPPPADAEMRALARLCRGLDGLPLAMVLLAAQLRNCAVADVARELEGRFQDLPLPDQTGYRHGSLTRMLDWSFELLSEKEQLLLQRLTVFAGIWPVEAAAEVCGLPPLEPVAVPGLVANLVARSLIAGPIQTQQQGLRMLETIRQFVAAKAPNMLEQENLRPRLARWLDGELDRLGRRRCREMVGPGPSRTYLPDVRASIDWAYTAGDVLLGQRLTIGFTYYWHTSGLDMEAAQRLTQAWEMSDGTTPPAVKGLLGIFLHGEKLSVRLPFHGDRPRYAREELEPALAALRAEGAPVWWLVEGLLSAGWLLIYIGDRPGGLALWQEGVALTQRHELPSPHMQFLALIAGSLADAGDLAGARGHFEAALDLAVRWKLRRGLTMLRLADAEFVSGQIARAIAVGRDAIGLDEPMQPILRQTLNANLASYLLLAGRTEEAVAQAEAALRITLRHNFSQVYAWTLERGALIAARLGHRDLAVRLAALGDALAQADHRVRRGPEQAIHAQLKEMLEEAADPEGLLPVEQALAMLAELYGTSLPTAGDHRSLSGHR